MTDYFYIIAITWMAPGNNIHIQNRWGIAEVADGESQKSICETIFTQACIHFGAPAGSTSISYYYLARNEL